VIDYLAVMLVSVGAGLALLALYLFVNPAPENRPTWGFGFGATALILAATSIPMVVTWPLPGSYNIAYGEPALMFGALFTVAGLALVFRLDLLGPAIWGFFAGIAATIVGVNIIGLHMSSEPTVAGLGFILAGVGGILTLPAVIFKNQKWVVWLAALVLAVAAILWLYTGFLSYPGHMADFAKYVPAYMK
jgi:putative membrane protein